MGLVRREKTITVATMDNKLTCFSSKGRKLWHLTMPDSIMCLEPIDIESRGVHFTAVALHNNQARRLSHG